MTSLPDSQLLDLKEKAERVEVNVVRVQLNTENWALHMAARLSGTVYLVGSILHNPEPRDIDIRIVIPDDEFGLRYGMEMREGPPIEKPGGISHHSYIHWDKDGPTQRWVDDTAKLGRGLLKPLRHNVDVKVWPLSYWREDAWPPPIVLAAPSPHWFVYNQHVPDPTIDSAALQAGGKE